MSFAMSDEQVLLRDTARAFVARHCPPEQAKEWDDNAVGKPPTFLTIDSIAE